jgi:serine/threonine protein kinase
MVIQRASKGQLDITQLEGLSSPDRVVRSQCILLQLCQSVDYLHGLQIAHRDLKPENILVMSNTDTVKLCDFGWATWWIPMHFQTTLCGTPEFMPPEFLSTSRCYSPEYVDPWALGVLAMELVQTTSPFSIPSSSLIEKGDVRQATFERIRCYKGHPVDRNADPDYRDFVCRLLKVEPSSRMTAGEASNHAFLRSARQSRAPN